MLNFEQLYEHILVLEVKASKANIAQFKKKYGLGPDSDEAVAELINDFNKELKRGTMKQKDIFAFDSYNDFIQALDRAQSQQTKAELKRAEREVANALSLIGGKCVKQVPIANVGSRATLWIIRDHKKHGSKTARELGKDYQPFFSDVRVKVTNRISDKDSAREPVEVDSGNY